MQNDKEKLPKESANSEQKQPEITKDGVKKLSDAELNEVAGGKICPPGCHPTFLGYACSC